MYLKRPIDIEVDDDGEEDAISHQVGQIVGGGLPRTGRLAWPPLLVPLPGPMINSFDQLTFQFSNSIPHMKTQI